MVFIAVSQSPWFSRAFTLFIAVLLTFGVGCGILLLESSLLEAVAGVLPMAVSDFGLSFFRDYPCYLQIIQNNQFQARFSVFWA